MAHPLSPLSDAGQNLRSPPTTTRTYKSTTIETHAFNMDHESENFFDAEDGMMPSSPFVADVDPTLRSPFRNHSPSKNRSPQKSKLEDRMGVPLTETALRDNQSYTRTVALKQEIVSDEPFESSHDRDNMTISSDHYAGADETGFSTFSAVPQNMDMTDLVRLGQSPPKSSPTRSSPTKSSRHRDEIRTPRSSRPNTPGTTRQRDHDMDPYCISPTPRQRHQYALSDNTNLLDFTEQLSEFSQPGSRSPTRPPRSTHHSQPFVSPRRMRSPTRDGYPSSTPSSRHQANLLDFELPPAPTPRSVPTITPRELEALKSSYLSQISSITATLSGKEAEIAALAAAKSAAESRAGDALEATREANAANEALLAEKTGWEARDRETQTVLRSLRAEFRSNEKEREELTARTTDLAQRLDEAETRAENSESRVAALQSSVVVPADGSTATPVAPGTSNKTVEMAVEKVARELHTLYKAKHEAKVGALKKSYEARWEKRIRELQMRNDDLTKEIEDMRLGRDATMSGVVPGMLAHAQDGSERQLLDEERLAREKEFEAEKKIAGEREEALRRRLASLEASGTDSRREFDSLSRELERMQRDNSEMVSVVKDAMDAMEAMEMQALQESVAAPAPREAEIHATAAVSEAPKAAKASGLRGPGFGLGESRIGMMKRSISGAGGAGAGRSGMMSNIERMGRGRGGE